jgi:hypothetical protein
MSYQTTALLPCQDIQGRLEDLWRTPSFPGADDKMPFSDMLNSQINRYPIQSLMVRGGAKRSNVIVTYFPRLTENLVTTKDATDITCVQTAKYGNISRTYTPPTTALTSGEVISAADLPDFCGDNPQYFEMVVARHIDVVERKLATQQAQEAVLLNGTWGNGIFTTGNAVGNVNASNQYVWSTRYADGKPDPEAWPTLRMAFDDVGAGDQMFIAGGKTGRSYFNASMIGCCTDAGMDLGEALRMFGMAYAYDTRLTAALGSTNEFLATNVGTLIPVYFTMGAWKDGMDRMFVDSANYRHTVISSPRWGVPMDLVVSENCGEVSITVSTAEKLINLPTDFYSTPDPYAGKNGVFQGLITNP